MLGIALVPDERSDKRQVFNEFVHAEKVPSACSYLNYEASKVQECIEYHDVGATFCTAIIILQDSLTDSLQEKDYNLPESLEPGDVVFMDRIAILWLTEEAREKDRE